MSWKTAGKIVNATFATLAVLLTNPAHAATCTYPGVLSGGIWTYFGCNDYFTVTIVNLTDYLLYNGGSVDAVHWVAEFQAPFGDVPIGVADLNGDGTNELGVPPYSGVTWSSAVSECPTPQHYEGEIVFDLRGYTDSGGATYAAPTWPNKFHVVFTSQDPGLPPGRGTWIALRPDDVSGWDGRQLFRSGAWTTPHLPDDVSAPSDGDDLEMRNIMTMSNRNVVVSLYSADNVNVVIVVRQTNWEGPPIPSNSDPTAGMDSYRAWQLDWAENDAGSVPGPSGCND